VHLAGSISPTAYETGGADVGTLDGMEGKTPENWAKQFLEHGVRVSPRLFADEWAFIVEQQRFLLRQPTLHVPAIESAIDDVRQGSAGALANLLQAGERTLGNQLAEFWLDLDERLGGKATD